jgi:hypothetical protein
MAAGTKGTQTLAGLSKKPDWAKPIKINAGIRNPELLGRMSQQSGMEQQSGAVGSSFGRMMGGSPQMGGGMCGMRNLEAASMRLADAATKRNIQKEEVAFAREQESKAQDYKTSESQSKIASLEGKLERLKSTQPKTEGERRNLVDAIRQTESEIAGLRRNIGTSLASNAANARMRARI